VKKRWFAVVGVFLVSMVALVVMLCVLGSDRAGASASAQAAALALQPTVTEVDPSSTPNDLDTPIVITGTGFVAVPEVYLGDTSLDDVEWMSSTTLTATVPWGMDPSIYTVTVTNPDGQSGRLSNAFTVTQGIGVWTTTALYGGHIRQLLLHPLTPTIVYALAAEVGILASYDAGAHWEPIFTGEGPWHIAIDQQNPDVMYGSGAPYLVRTVDGGNTWERIAIHRISGQSCYYQAVTHPSSRGVVYAAANPPEGLGQEGGIYRSDDYGDNWITLTLGLTDTQVTELAFNPHRPDTMLAGTEGGNIFFSDTGGQTWSWTAQLSSTITGLYFNPFAAQEAWASAEGPVNMAPYLYRSDDLATWTPISIDESLTWSSDGWTLEFTSDTIWAASVGLYTSTNGGTSWNRVVLPASAVGLAINPQDPQHIYVGSFRGGVFKSSDGGRTWHQTNQGLTGVVPHAVAVAPHDPDTVYAQTPAMGLFKSNNGGRSWQSVYASTGGGLFYRLLAVDPFSPTRVYLGGGGFISGGNPTSVDPSSLTRVYVGEHTPDGAIMHITPDGGSTWQSISMTMPVTYAGWGAAFGVVAPHTGIPGRVFAGMAFEPPGYHDPVIMPRGGLYISDDYGEHWAYLEPAQPISGVIKLAFDAGDSNLVYMGTRGTGLWKSTDGGTSWQQVTSFPGLPYIEGLVAHPHIPNMVYALTYNQTDRHRLHVSQDAGESWKELPYVLDLPDVDYGYELLFHPTGPVPTLYTGCGKGLCRSRDGGRSWEKVDGAPSVTALAVSSDEERLVVYVGSSGAVISLQEQAAGVREAAAEVSELIPGRGSVTGAGVYRMTSVLANQWVYLPLILRTYAP
jgi:photosystem II stability/assembly factor-like uncharacterized protein